MPLHRAGIPGHRLRLIERHVRQGNPDNAETEEPEREANSLLGSEGSGALALANGARTSGTTFGAMAALADGWTLSGSATLARTAGGPSAKSGLTLAQGGLESTAFEIAVAKSGLLSDIDSIRVSLAQPLHVESGSLNYTALEVTDRETGAVAPVTQTWNVGGSRELRMESIYSVPLLAGRAHVDAFGLVDMNPPTTPDTRPNTSKS